MCSTNAHAKQTILRGCCNTTTTCCNFPSGFGARLYCECNDTAGNNSSDNRIPLCSVLTAGFTGQAFANSAAYYAYLQTQSLTAATIGCGPLLIFGLTSGFYTLTITIIDGVVVLSGNVLAAGSYQLYIANRPVDVTNGNLLGPCGTFVISA